ncbi:MAG: DUF1631 family protein [Pseudomonadales bacterium]|nr:DUF1631 family protein [Pseudomonadales bacterium]
MNKRKHERQPSEIEAVFSVKAGAVHTGMIKDFSQGGIFLQFTDPSQYIQLKHASIHMGDTIETVVSHQANEVHIRGKIAHYNDVGLGIQFLERHVQNFQLLELVSRDQEAAVDSARKQFLNNQRTVPHDVKERILKSFSNLGLEFLNENFNEFFDVLDEVMLEEADKQKSDEDQHPFFDAMALLRKHRKNIVESIGAELKIVLDEVAVGKEMDEPTKKINPELAVNQLSLVEKEDFEDWLIVRVVVSRADLQFKEQLLELQLRMGAAFPVKTGGSTQNPFSPASICRSLHRCIRHLRFEQKIERVIFRTFQEKVVDRLGKFYASLNKVLEENGILPDIDVHRYLATEAAKKRKASGDTIAPPKTAAANQAAAQNESQHDNSATGGAQLAQGQPGAGQQQGNVTQGNFGNGLPLPEVQEGHIGDVSQPGVTNAGPNTAMPASSYENTGQGVSLSRLQESLAKARNAYSTASRLLKLHQRVTSSPEEAEAIPAAQSIRAMPAAANPVRDELATNMTSSTISVQMDGIQKQLASSQISFAGDQPLIEFVETNVSDAGDISGSEREAIEMLDALFGNIVDNQRVAPQLKTVLRQMEVPVLRVMLSDPSLFQAEQHPARQLINSLALLSDRDSINLANNVKAVEETVSSVLAGYEGDLSVFETAQQKLSNELDREKRVIKRNLERVTEACRGQEKVNQANLRIDAEINKRFSERRIPLVVVNLLAAGWRELMRLCLFREGVDSRAWSTTLLVLDQLLYRLSPGLYDIEKITFSEDELLKLIEKGLAKIPQTKFNQSEIVAELNRLLHVETIDESELVTYHAEVSDSEDPVVELKRLGGGDNEQSLQRWIKRVQELKEGQWLEFDALSEYTHLYQLAWIGENAKRYVFVNHHGMKVSDMALAEVALKLKKGDIRVLSEEGFSAVDRGLDALVQKIYDQLAFESAHDQLTGLVTRKEFERCLARSVGRAKKDREQYLLSYFDLQEFKVINNTCGYEAGDTLLRSIAKRLVAESDSSDVLGRLGADQFAMLSVVKNDSEAYRKADHLKQVIEKEKFEWNQESFVISCIASMVVFDHNNNHVLELLRGVESACIIAKKSGHKEIQVFDPLDDRVEERDSIMSWVARINKALENNQLKLRCQKIAPIEDLEVRRKPHFEILLTVVDENGEHLPPADFIRAAEEYSRMASVDRWVIDNVLNWMTENNGFLDFIGGFSINLSGHSMNDDSFLDYIFEKLVETQVPRDKVIFEVTETTAVANLEDAADFIREMREIGCRFSLDDFGAGQSSYAYLKHLPVDFIKIDGSFVRNIAEDDVDYAMVKSITDMGHYLEKSIIAEFVSSQDIYDTVSDIGVDYVQGYHLGKPVFLEQLIESEASA